MTTDTTMPDDIDAGAVEVITDIARATWGADRLRLDGILWCG